MLIEAEELWMLICSGKGDIIETGDGGAAVEAEVDERLGS
jgi:hypothetical protein